MDIHLCHGVTTPVSLPTYQDAMVAVLQKMGISFLELDDILRFELNIFSPSGILDFLQEV
jgi:hypothetical protein